jgi:hypothetical protein
MLHAAVVAMLLVLQQQHAAVVHGDTGTIEVTLHNDSASVRLSTPGRAFQLDLDSLTLAAWADTAAALRGPRKGARETEYPAARLATSLVAMAIIRLSTDSVSSYAFAATGYGGINGRVMLPYDSARRLFDVMRAPPLAESESRVFRAAEVNQPAHLMGRIPSAYALDVPKGAEASRARPIVFEFVVDTTGHVEQQTFRVVSSPDPGLAEAIAQSLRESPYRSAERNGHKVRQLVEMRVYAVGVRR